VVTGEDVGQQSRFGAGAVVGLAFALLVGPVAGCFGEHCEQCANTPDLLIYTDAPITQLALSGPACNGSMFKCLPNAFDNTIHPDCTRLMVVAKAEGDCIVDLTTTSGPVATIRRQFVQQHSACCGGLAEVNHAGYIDLRNTSDAGAD